MNCCLSSKMWFCRKSLVERIVHLTFGVLFWWPMVYSSTSDAILPHIWISSLTEGQWFGMPSPGTANLNLTFQNQSVLVVPKTVGQLTLECNATYPIMWNLGDSKINAEMYHWLRIRSKRSVSDIFDPSTFEYSSQLSISSPSNTHKFTGNYSCQSTAKAEIQKNMFIFWEGTYLLVHSKETLTAYVENDIVTLPCGISSAEKNKIPKLRKEPEKGAYADVFLNKSVQYYAAEGFVFKNVSYPVGRYKCLFDDGEDDYVIVNVRRRNQTEETLKKMKSNATYTYDDDKKELVCCSSSRRTPSIVSLPCEHAVTCQLREHILQPFHHIFSRSKKSGSCAKKRLRSGYHSGLFRCMGDGIDEYKEAIAPIQSFYESWNSIRNTTTFFSWEEIESQDMLTVLERSYRFNPTETISNKPKGQIYSNQRVSLDCHASDYYFSEGSQWLIRWKNKSLTLPKERPSSSGGMMYYRSSTNVLDIVAHHDMEAMICMAPVWNSSVWVAKTFFLYLNESISPNLTNSEIENYVWYTNETGKEISCEASGSPDPSIYWRKGALDLNWVHNYEIVQTHNNISNSIKSTLKIRRVAYSTHGEYTCDVSNYGGSISKIFQISVKESTSWGTATVLIISGFIICILIAGIFFFVNRLNKNKKAIQHLTSVHFKDATVREETVGADVNNTVYDNGKMNSQLIS